MARVLMCGRNAGLCSLDQPAAAWRPREPAGSRLDLLPGCGALQQVKTSLGHPRSRAACVERGGARLLRDEFLALMPASRWSLECTRQDSLCDHIRANSNTQQLMHPHLPTKTWVFRKFQEPFISNRWLSGGATQLLKRLTDVIIKDASLGGESGEGETQAQGDGSTASEVPRHREPGVSLTASWQGTVMTSLRVPPSSRKARFAHPISQVGKPRPRLSWPDLTGTPQFLDEEPDPVAQRAGHGWASSSSLCRWLASVPLPLMGSPLTGTSLAESL